MKKLLFTGVSGFLGYSIRPILEKSYDVHTIGLTDDDDIKINIAKEVPPINTHYDVVLHAAGKAHVVPKTEAEQQVFFDVNYQGTVNLCKALENAGVPKALVFISTVAVYGCEFGELIDEYHPLNGDSPYAKSKIMAEEYLTKWCLDHQVRLGILRPSLLAGKNAPGNLGAMVNGVRRGFYLNIAGGKVQKSVLMAEDIARLLPLLEEKGGIYNVCDTYQPTFGELSASVAKQLGKHKPISIPYWMAWCMAKVGDLLGNKSPINSYKLEKMTKSLTFSNVKARRELGWEPLDVLTNMLLNRIAVYDSNKRGHMKRCFPSLLIFIVLLSVTLLGSCDKLPEEVNVSDIPAYYFENNYLDQRARAVNDAIKECDGDCETFFWITDIHWEPDLNARNAPAMICYLANKTGVNMILDGGDNGNSSVICSNAIDRLRDAIGSDRVYSVNGNHEINDASRYERPYERVHRVLRGHCSDISYGDKNKSYFYFENAASKTRYIGLSTYGLFINNHYKSDYTDEQLLWLTETALDVEEGWTIVIFTHALYVVDPYVNSCSVLSQSFVDAIDFYQGKGKIACVLMGDSHIDRVHIGKTCVPYIISQCDRTEPYKGENNVERVRGTISENHFEVVLIDKVKQEVRLYAIGSDARDGVDNEPGEIVDVRILKYGE